MPNQERCYSRSRRRTANKKDRGVTPAVPCSWPSARLRLLPAPAHAEASGEAGVLSAEQFFALHEAFQPAPGFDGEAEVDLAVGVGGLVLDAHARRRAAGAG